MDSENKRHHDQSTSERIERSEEAVVEGNAEFTVGPGLNSDE